MYSGIISQLPKGPVVSVTNWLGALVGYTELLTITLTSTMLRHFTPSSTSLIIHRNFHGIRKLPEYR
jgi:hypothetical protein